MAGDITAIEQTGAGKRNTFAKLRSVRKRYMNSFTMHALNHIINGSPVEKIFWIVKLMIFISLACYFSKDIFVSFSSYETDTITKVEVKRQLQLPRVRLCFGNLMSSFADCTSNSSKSYDKKICEFFETKACNDFIKSTSNISNIAPDLLDMVSEEGDIACTQCVVVNPIGNLYQNSSLEAMRYTMVLNSSQFPLFLAIGLPEDKVIVTKSPFDTIAIDRYGDYHFVLDKITLNRLPHPYSNCIVQGSDEALKKNMIKGDYNLGKCRTTCIIKTLLENCGIINTMYRPIVRDAAYIQTHHRDQNLSSIDQCMVDRKIDIVEAYDRCAVECLIPCHDVSYKIKEKYESNSHADSRVRLFFYYQELKETIIEHVPRYEISTVVSNFGGQLGLMAGVSAISVLELLIWLILVLIDRFHSVYKNVVYGEKNMT